MRRTYPYLQDGYIVNYNDEAKRRAFLQKIDNFANQRQYVRITLLNWEEEPIKALEGTISAGSLSKNGSSSVRCTCQFSASLGYGDYDIQKEEMDFAINKKIFLELGVKNDSDEFLEYPILWFPQGVFFISSFSINSSASGAVNINVGLKDKMAMLNGDVGGTLPALVVLDTMDTQLPDGTYQKQKVPIYSIIQEMVNHYGKEPLSNIVIEDIDTRIRKVMKWNAENPIYLISNAENSTGEDDLFYQFILTEPTEGAYQTFNNGDDIGYIMSDFVIPDELTAAAGESITSVLDRIVQILGNFEYFYDEFGIFHFREIKNYVNTSEGKIVLDEASENQYLVEINNSRSTYSFTDTGNITSINITPKYENIKNDYVVLGLRKSTVDDTSFEVRYHLAIDEKPPIQFTKIGNDIIYYYGKYGGQQENLVFYSEKTIYGYTGNIIAGFALGLSFDKFPEIGNFDMLYQDISDIENNRPVYQWNGSTYERVYIYDDTLPEADQLQPPVIYNEFTDKVYYVKDWRTLLYLQGKYAEVNGTEKNHYYEELSANWPTVYSLIEQCFYAEGYEVENRQNSKDPRVKHLGNTLNEHTAFRSLTDGNYYLDFINAPTSSLGGYSVDAIGRRTDLVYDEKINCLFQPEIPNVDILNIDDLVYNQEESTLLKPHTNIKDQREESVLRHQPYTQVGNDIYSHLTVGGYCNPAFDRIKYELYLHTRYQRQVSLTALPVFYLEPNRRVTINEKSTNTYGDFIIDSIGITLGPGANMSISANEVFERE